MLIGDFLEDNTTRTVASASENIEMDSSQSNGLILPKEVLENIFCRLGLVNLYTLTCRVCRLWNSIITAEVTLKRQPYAIQMQIQRSACCMSLITPFYNFVSSLAILTCHSYTWSYLAFIQVQIYYSDQII